MKEININLLNINFKDFLPHIIDAYTSVYGEDYRNTIEYKINNTLIYQYSNYIGLENYINNLKTYKKKELIIRLLKLCNLLNKEDEMLDYESIYKKYNISFIDINSLDDMNSSSIFKFNPDKFDDTFINVMRDILGKRFESVFEYEKYKKSVEFIKDLNKINEVKTLFIDLVKEYNDWLVDLLECEDYIEQERNKHDDFFNKSEEDICNSLFYKLPNSIQEILLNLPKNKRMDILVGNGKEEALIDSFSQKNMDLLSMDTQDYLKYSIIKRQKRYLEEIGISIPKNLLLTRGKNEIKEWIKFINRQDVKKYLPHCNIIEDIIINRESKREKYENEYIRFKEDYQRIINDLYNNQKTNTTISNEILSEICYILKNNNICVSINSKDYNSNYSSIMFYTIVGSMFGNLDFCLLHEFGHVIDQNNDKIGLETQMELPNIVDNRYRKYEVLNEVLTDIYALEAKKYLENKGIYLMENDTISEKDESDFNTSMYLKKLLEPFVNKYRKYISKSKINSSPEELYNYIGESNYEELNNIINRLQKIIEEYYISSENKKEDLESRKDYIDEVNKLNKLYASMEEYYQNIIGSIDDKKLC
ncbi:MAG: hypothetical protein ACI33S_01875 [Bacilli bacterium]